MPSYWYPNTCPSDGQCQVEIDAAGALVDVVTACPAHALLRGAMTDAALFDRIKTKNILRNKAIYIAAIELALPEGESVAVTVDDADIIYLKLPIDAAFRARVQNKIDAALGAGLVVVEIV